MTGGGGTGAFNGGLVGALEGVTIIDSYATGNVIGEGSSDYSGGFAGAAYSGSNNISDSYSAGNVSGQGAFGGFLGTGNGGGNPSNVYSYNYWDTTASGQSNAIGASGGSIANQIIGETTPQMQNINTAGIYNGWDLRARPSG